MVEREQDYFVIARLVGVLHRGTGGFGSTGVKRQRTSESSNKK